MSQDARFWMVGVLCFLLLGCVDDTTSLEDACINQYSVQHGYDHEEILEPVPPYLRDLTAPDFSDPREEAFRQQCREDKGSNCEKPFITRAAAQCLAREAGFFADADTEQAVFWLYHATRKLVAWAVLHVEAPDEDGHGSASYLIIDAASAKIYGREHILVIVD